MESAQKSARLNSNSSHLVEDLWPEVLVRLPVKSLCRFRSVSKSWNSLIPSSFFINLHSSFTRSVATSSAKSYNIRHDLHFPFQFLCCVTDDLYSISVVEVIHGLVCLSYSMDSSYDSTILWNPAIHKYLTLPRLQFPSHIDSAVSESESDDVEQSARFYSNAVGFGYDASRDDFKVVRIWMCRNSINNCCGFIPTTYEVYSTRQGLWGMAIVENLKSSMMFDIATSRTGCFFNGRIHWLVTTYDLRVDSVLMFDCASQEFTLVDFPKEIYEPKTTWIDPLQNPLRKSEVLEYGGMLSLLVHRHWEDYIELWAMKEHGLPTTWHKLFTIDRGCDVLNLYQPSFLKLAPHGPKQWIKFHKYVDKFRQVYAYEESMILTDDTNAKSYTNKDTVDIIVPTHPKFWHLYQ